jgi:phosphoribosyl-ATP pyrophosphohydrolase/phosphoribosyl-AMP cyclohydrolase/histidinol dehydrogenase
VRARARRTLPHPLPPHPTPHPPRKGIWRKGESSGNVQQLLRLQLDCDCDALLFTVRQQGGNSAFCHLMTRSCWGEEAGLSALERTLASRIADAPAGSYTKRLFDDPELLRHKLMEEAQELSEASEPSHVAAEAADLIYFALVACTKAGVSLSDVEAHLNKRALKVRRRQGNSKEFRIAAAAAFSKSLEEAKGAAGAAAAEGAATSAAAAAPANSN